MISTRRDGIAGVQSNARFIEHKECVHEASPQTGRQIHPLRFAAGKRARRAVERQITESDVDQVPQTVSHFVKRQRNRIGQPSALT